jgi:4'-phosphopantetheinyl transferase EntD
VALPHGIAAGVHLPRTPDPVPDAVLADLHPAEAAHARTLGGFRQVQFAGGRLALRGLFDEIEVAAAPVLSDGYGAPVLPPGIIGSVTHKQDLAIAILARGEPGLGVDLEDTDRDRPGVARRVLRAEELAEVEALPPERQWTETAIRFALKEAVYKALHPFLLRYIGFGEVAIRTSPDGSDTVVPHLPEGPFVFTARHTWVDDRVLATVRAGRG